jgi:hypothetical protein
VDAAEPREKDYVIWDDDLPGVGLRVFVSGKRSYLLQYRSAGRSRRYTIGLHGVWTPETARQEAKVQLGRVAAGDNPAEERQLDHKAVRGGAGAATRTIGLLGGILTVTIRRVPRVRRQQRYGGQYPSSFSNSKEGARRGR